MMVQHKKQREKIKEKAKLQVGWLVGGVWRVEGRFFLEEKKIKEINIKNSSNKHKNLMIVNEVVLYL